MASVLSSRTSTCLVVVHSPTLWTTATGSLHVFGLNPISLSNYASTLPSFSPIYHIPHKSQVQRHKVTQLSLSISLSLKGRTWVVHKFEAERETFCELYGVCKPWPSSLFSHEYESTGFQYSSPHGCAGDDDAGFRTEQYDFVLRRSNEED